MSESFTSGSAGGAGWVTAGPTRPFGCVLYDALAGRPAFVGETLSDTIAAVLDREPDWQALPPTTPAIVRSLMRRCLSKDVNHRLQHIGDARVEIEEALAEPADVSQMVAAAGEGRALPLGLTALASLLLGGLIVWTLMSSSAPVVSPVTRSVIPLSPAEELDVLYASAVTISPDGRYVAYIARRGNSRRLYLRAMDELKARPIDGTEGARIPFFSPDGQWLGFQGGNPEAEGIGRRLMKVSVSGGAPVAIAPAIQNIRGASWSPDGSIVYNPYAGLGLWRVSADGGEPEVLTTPNREQGEKSHRLPEVLPGGNAVLFTIGNGEITSWDDASIAVLSLETREYRVLVEGGMNSRYSTTGHVIYARAGTLLAVPFDLGELLVKGAPVPVLKGLTTSRMQGGADFSMSREGSLVYAPGDSWGDENRVLSIDRQGRVQPLLEDPRAYRTPHLSPDGRLLALLMEGANVSNWIYDISRSTLTRLSFGFDNARPIWTPDGRRVTFGSNRGGSMDIFWQAADGSGRVERMVRSEYYKVPTSWSPDGRVLAFGERHPETASDIWTLSMDDEPMPEPFLRTEFNEMNAVFSPNGRWIAYASTESGQHEVYVRAFPSADGKRQISAAGGRTPVWNPKGRELFYREGDKVMAVDVDTEGELTVGNPRPLFVKDSLLRHYDVTPDGQRFIMVEGGESQPAPTELVLVQNWFEELKRLVPTDN